MDLKDLFDLVVVTAELNKLRVAKMRSVVQLHLLTRKRRIRQSLRRVAKELCH